MSTLKATNIRNESSASNNIVLDSGGGAIFSGVTTFSSSVNFNNVDSLNLGTGTTISSPASNTFIVSTNGSERIRVNSSGNLGIGTTNPIGQLQVSSGPVIIGAATSTGTASQTLQVTGGGYVSGNVGIGSTNPSAKLDVNGNIFPTTDATFDLGSTTKRWNNVYTTDLQLSNKGSVNEVDGTWGQYTIQEGENDLYLLNRRNGKKYKFVLQEVN